MSSLTNYIEEQIGTHLLRTGSWTKPLDLYVGLLTAAGSGEAGTVTEVAGGSYARVDVGPADANWTPPVGSNKLYANAAAVTFPAPTADWHSGVNPVSHFGIWDDPTAGTLLAFAPLTFARFIYGNDPAPIFDIGALRLQFSGVATDYLVGVIGDHLLRTGTWTKPATLYVGLEVSGAEVAAGDYVRKLVGPADADWAAPTGGNGLFTNLNVVSWASPVNDWGLIDTVSVWDALTVGNKLLEIPITPKSILTGALPPNLPVGGLALTIA